MNSLEFVEADKLLHLSRIPCFLFNLYWWFLIKIVWKYKIRYYPNTDDIQVYFILFKCFDLVLNMTKVKIISRSYILENVEFYTMELHSCNISYKQPSVLADKAVKQLVFLRWTWETSVSVQDHHNSVRIPLKAVHFSILLCWIVVSMLYCTWKCDTFVHEVYRTRSAKPLQQKIDCWKPVATVLWSLYWFPVLYNVYSKVLYLNVELSKHLVN